MISPGLSSLGDALVVPPGHASDIGAPEASLLSQGVPETSLPITKDAFSITTKRTQVEL